MTKEIKIGYSSHHGWHVENKDTGIIANGFASQEAAKRSKRSIQITNKYIEKFKKGELLNDPSNN